MRKSFVALALLAGAIAALANTAIAREEFGDDVGSKLVNAQMLREMRSAAALPGFSGSGSDTTFVGFVPGKVSATNYWGIGKGCFHVYNTAATEYGYWGWDGAANIAEVHGDSLFGWWPTRNLYTSTGGLTLEDDNRPWWAVDMGNMANYVINQRDGMDRTFGIVGVWHRDNGNVSGGGVAWAPLDEVVNVPAVSTHSLWCGLRRDGDLAFSDPITGNAFNAGVLMNSGVAGGATGGGTGTNKKFPGYASQWDQMAYRDIDLTGSDGTISVRFRFRTNMSTGRVTATGTRTGWYDKDPLAVTASAGSPGNFISSNDAGTDAPIDSFMVYVGAPVDDNVGFLGSDGFTHPVYDPQRRWFSEVLRANEALYTQLVSTMGDNAEQTLAPAGVSTAGWGNKARLVFRSKTNRGFDDEGGSSPGAYSSAGQGAVVIDDVEVSLDSGTSWTTVGDFETAGQVDNDDAVNPLDAWKSTGKPPAIYHHVHNSLDLIYEDLCGPVGGALRICNLTGNIISAGDHENGEAVGGLDDGKQERERFDGINSPAVNLLNTGSGALNANEMDIDHDIATVTEDYYIIYDIYTGVFDFFGQGNAWRFSFSAWPGTQVDGVECWSDWRFPPFIIFNPDKQCFQDQEPGLAYGLIRWSSAAAVNGANYPDSLRIYLGKVQQCFRFGLSATCSPTDGCYWDNVTLAFVDGAAPPFTIDIWQWINDTFTVNGKIGTGGIIERDNVAPGTAAFDTTTALVKSGLNTSQTAGNTTRYAVPGDTSAVSALGDNVRMDMVFRIDPGVGNYVAVGNKSTGLRRVPTSTTAVNYVTPSDPNNFWEQYQIDNGLHGTPAGHPAGSWSNLVWNSARCDTAEVNLYQISARAIGIPVPGTFATMYEETDPKFVDLGIAKKRCFLNTATATANQLNTVCDIALTDGWPTTAGYVAENGLPLGETYEYTKILPDGQFTPGTHVEYFMRREDDPIAGGPYFAPDTAVVFPQASEGSSDGHRWQEFSVLPDRWKHYTGLGAACMLYVDLNDRRGNERVWVSIADSIGATDATKYGAHNGWHAAVGASLNDVSGFVYDKNSQPGTTWDMYGVKASESLNSKVATIGVELSNHASSFQIDNKWSMGGPTPGMLEAYYKVLLVLSGDLNSGILGPFSDLGGNDVKMLQDFLLAGTAGDPNHRGLWIEGDGFVESADGITSNATLLASYLYVSLRDASYKVLTGNVDACADLVPQSMITTSGDIYGVRNGCLFTDDVLDAGVNSVPASLYAPVGIAVAPVVAGVFHDIETGSGEYWQSLVDGWDIENLRTRHCNTSWGRQMYAYNVLTNIFGKICTISGSPPITTDAQNNLDGSVFVDFMNLRNNPLVSGRATVVFGLSKADRVEVKVFDVSGRLVRTLADRQYAAGNHSLIWDGTSNDGHQAARGVYFTQVKYVNSRFTDAKKLTVLK